MSISEYKLFIVNLVRFFYKNNVNRMNINSCLVRDEAKMIDYKKKQIYNFEARKFIYNLYWISFDSVVYM